jgi:type II secretion system protein G
MVLKPHIHFLKQGFTLLELLIVISIIGILVTVATASYTSSQQKARNSRRMSDIKSIQNAAEQFYADNSSSYPSDQAAFTATTTYLPSGWPQDPKNTSASPRSYTYTHVASPEGFFVCAQMEGAVGNATAADGTGFPVTPSTGAYWCARNLQ